MKRREDCADARMTALAQPFDNTRLVGVRRLPQLAERRQETCVIWRLGVYRNYAPKGEQQHEQPLPARREVFHYL